MELACCAKTTNIKELSFRMQYERMGARPDRIPYDRDGATINWKLGPNPSVHNKLVGLGAQDAVILTWQLSIVDGILTFLAEPGTAVDFRKIVHGRCWVTPSEF